MVRRVLWASLATIALVIGACSESGTEAGDGGGADPGGGAETTGPGTDSVVAEFAGQEWFLGTVPDEPVAADDGAEPIPIGLINQEDTPLGSFPELRRATEATVDFINAELGGVGGRPLELHSCIVSFDVEQSQACAQEMVQRDVVALSGGIDVTSNGSVPVLERNGIAQIGGIPANLIEQRSEVNFFFSGGTTGAVAAFLQDVSEQGGQTAVIGYGEFDAFDTAAREYGVPVGEHLGVEVDLAPFPITATDFLPILTGMADADPDAIILMIPGSSCVPAMETYDQLGIDAQLYLVGACAADEIIEAAGPLAEGIVFNSEGPIGDDVEGDLFFALNERYADGEGSGSGTIAARSALNLYALLDELGPDGVSREGVLELVRAAEDRPSFWGHPYTCDGAQVAGLPALCAPQQTLFTVEGVQDFRPRGEPYRDTVALFAAALD